MICLSSFTGVIFFISCGVNSAMGTWAKVHSVQWVIPPVISAMSHKGNKACRRGRLEKLGRPLTRKEESACYQPMKALCACLVVFAVPLALSLYLAATAKPYTYALQDLPAWLTGTYGAREDVMAPLAAYAQSATFTLRDGIRLVVRLAVLIYINLFPDPQTMAQMIDRLSPLMVMTYPIACMIGYLRAPAVYAKRQSMQRRAKKAAVRKAQKKSMVDELLGSGGDVHYGQRVGQEEHKKKELI